MTIPLDALLSLAVGFTEMPDDSELNKRLKATPLICTRQLYTDAMADATESERSAVTALIDGGFLTIVDGEMPRHTDDSIEPPC